MMGYEHLDLDAARERLEQAGYFVLDAEKYAEMQRKMNVLWEQLQLLYREVGNV